MGKILAICTSPKRGTVKTEVPSAVLTPEWGIVSDAHGGSWHRQVSGKDRGFPQEDLGGLRCLWRKSGH